MFSNQQHIGYGYQKPSENFKVFFKVTKLIMLFLILSK